MFCNKCGTEVNNGEAFCPTCGNAIRGASSPATDSKKTSSGAADLKQRVSADSSDKLKKAKDSASEAGNWYAVNWKRVFNGDWSGISLKHHLAWIGMHLGVILVLFLLIHAIGKPGKTSADHGKAESSAETAGTTVNENEGSSWLDFDSDEDTDTEEASEEDTEENGWFDSVKDTVDDVRDNADYYKKVLFSSLDGTWTNADETFALTIGQDGTVKIADASGTIGVDAFTYTEVDDDTIRLKASSDNFLASMLSIDMDYEVNGETLTVSLMDMTFDLTRKK